jgi:hypothetical protein
VDVGNLLREVEVAADDGQSTLGTRVSAITSRLLRRRLDASGAFKPLQE